MWLLAWCLSLGTWKVPDSICQPGLDLSAKWVSSGELGLFLTNANSEDAMTQLNTAAVLRMELLWLWGQWHHLWDTARHRMPPAQSRSPVSCFEEVVKSVPTLFLNYQLPQTALLLFKEQGLLNLNPWPLCENHWLWACSEKFLGGVSGSRVASFSNYWTKNVSFPQSPVWFSSLELMYKMPVLQLQLEPRWWGWMFKKQSLKNKLKCLLVSQCW